jgi:hypothetical protein
VGANVLIVSDNFSTGDVAFDPGIPVTDARANINVIGAGYVRTFGILDRSASIALVLPYARGNLSGVYLGQRENSAHRSGFGDPVVRLAVNLFGAPAMTPKEFAAYRPETIVGASLVIVAPLGGYDGEKAVNVGSNRWSFKPEIGVSRAIGPWTLEADVGVWVYTDNTDFLGGKVRAQDPIGSAEMHAIYTIRPRMWAAFDANYYNGGRTTIDGRANFDLQQNSRIGATLALPITGRQSLKLVYSRGARWTIGGDFQAFGITYQFAWID